MKVYISGGCKNGKSYYAQEYAAGLAKETDTPLYYIATMIPHDEEDRARIRKHIADRDGWGFETIEQGVDMCDIFDKVDENGTFLLDSVTALLSNEMFNEDGMHEEACFKVAQDLKHVASRAANIVFVSDNIYSDAEIYETLSEKYRKGLGYIDTELARVCDIVVEVAYGSILKYKE